jgi:hypothetical protein
MRFGALVVAGVAFMAFAVQARADAPPFDHIDDIEALQAAVSQAARAMQDSTRTRSRAAKTLAEISAIQDEYMRKMQELSQASAQRYEQLLTLQRARQDEEGKVASAAAGAPAAAASVQPGADIAARAVQGASRAAPAATVTAAAAPQSAAQDGLSFDHIDTLDALDQAVGKAQLDVRNEHANRMKARTPAPPGGDLSSQLERITAAYERRRQQLLAQGKPSPSRETEQSTDERMRLAMEGELRRMNEAALPRLPEPGSPEMAAIEALPPSDRLRAFSYEDYRYLGSAAGRDYFMLPATGHPKGMGSDPYAPLASFRGTVNIAIVHAVGEDEHILDFDFFPFQTDGNWDALGYRLADAEVTRFNRDLGPALDPILERSPSLWRVSVYHYVRSRPLPLLRGMAQPPPAGQNPVLFARWKPGANGSWEPAYRYGDNEVDHFDINSGYSYTSSLRVIRWREEQLMTGSNDTEARLLSRDVEEAYRHASAAAKARRGQIAHWTMGYWGIAHDKLGRNLLEGRFDQVPHDGNFDDFFMAWVELYEWRCAEFISPAARFEDTRTWREMRQYGYIEEWVDKKETFEAIMEPRFLETFRRNYERGPLGARPGGPQTSSKGLALSESAIRRNAIGGLLRGDGCESPYARRLADNLHRHTQTDDGN